MRYRQFIYMWYRPKQMSILGIDKLSIFDIYRFLSMLCVENMSTYDIGKTKCST